MVISAVVGHKVWKFVIIIGMASMSLVYGWSRRHHHPWMRRREWETLSHLPCRTNFETGIVRISQQQMLQQQQLHTAGGGLGQLYERMTVSAAAVGETDCSEDGNPKDDPTLSESAAANPRTVHDKLPRLFVGDLPTQPMVVTDWSVLGEWKHGCSSRLSEPVLQRRLSNLTQGAVVPLSADQSHYLTSVLRLNKSPKRSSAKITPFVRLWDIYSGEEWLAELHTLSFDDREKKNKRSSAETSLVTAVCRTKLRAEIPQSSTSMQSCWLCVAPPKKKDRLKWMIEKSTELDCTGFLLLDTDFSESFTESDKSDLHFYSKKHPVSASSDSTTSLLGKLPTYTIEAAEQCERLTLPRFLTVSPNPSTEHEGNDNFNTPRPISEKSNPSVATKLTDVLKSWACQARYCGVKLLVCRERSASRCLPVWSILDEIHSQYNEVHVDVSQSSLSVAFLIGPEGGWSPREEEILDKMEQTHRGFLYNVSLGSNVLRAETAAVAAMAAFSLFKEYKLEKHQSFSQQTQVCSDK